MSDTFSKVEVITGVARRRRFSTELKLALVAETMQPGLSVSYVARRHGLSPSLLFRWRRRDFLDHTAETHLVSRPECLQDLSQDMLHACKTIHVLATEVGEEETVDDAHGVGRDEVLDDLHAKLFVIDRGWDSSVFTGSFNATDHALEHIVEFMVELVGKKSRFGVEQFLRQKNGETNFSDLLQRYGESTPS
jgi:transposase-like protein